MLISGAAVGLIQGRELHPWWFIWNGLYAPFSLKEYLETQENMGES